MRAIFSAVMSGLRTTLRICAAMISGPLRILFGSGGGIPILSVPEVAPEIAVPEAPATDYAALHQGVTISLQTWAAQSLLADAMQALPPRWPREMREWARGLNRDELFALVDSDERAISAHLSGVFEIPRVRGLRPLAVSEWRSPARSISAGLEDPECDAIAVIGARL